MPDHRRAVSPLLLLPLAVLLAACENHPVDLLPGGEVPVPGDFVSLENDVQPVFDANCVFGGCHSGAIPAEGLSLEADKIFDPQIGLVDFPSLQANLLRVQRGSAMGSYLINKLEGTQLSVGGSGLQMPRFAQPLPDATIQIIKDWIDEGAQDN